MGWEPVHLNFWGAPLLGLGPKWGKRPQNQAFLYGVFLGDRLADLLETW